MEDGMQRYILTALAAAAWLSGTAWAQSSTPPHQAAPGSSNRSETRHMNQRMKKQRRRIRQGVKSGKITRRQGRALRNQDVRLHRDVRKMNRRSGGQLNPPQERRINRSLNRQSRRIYRARH
jgi:hypothetical protein